MNEPTHIATWDGPELGVTSEQPIVESATFTIVDHAAWVLSIGGTNYRVAAVGMNDYPHTCPSCSYNGKARKILPHHVGRIAVRGDTETIIIGNGSPCPTCLLADGWRNPDFDAR